MKVCLLLHMTVFVFKSFIFGSIFKLSKHFSRTRRHVFNDRVATSIRLCAFDRTHFENHRFCVLRSLFRFCVRSSPAVLEHGNDKKFRTIVFFCFSRLLRPLNVCAPVSGTRALNALRDIRNRLLMPSQLFAVFVTNLC